MYSKGNGICGDDDDDGCESVSHDFRHREVQQHHGSSSSNTRMFMY